MEKKGITADECSRLCGWWDFETFPEIKWFGKRVGVQDKIKSADLTHEFWEPRRRDLTSAASPGLRAPQWES